MRGRRGPESPVFFRYKNEAEQQRQTLTLLTCWAPTLPTVAHAMSMDKEAMYSDERVQRVPQPSQLPYKRRADADEDLRPSMFLSLVQRMSGTEAASITIDGHHIQPPGGLKKQKKDTVQVSLKECQSSPPTVMGPGGAKSSQKNNSMQLSLNARQSSPPTIMGPGAVSCGLSSGSDSVMSSPFGEVGFSQVSSVPETPSPLRQGQRNIMPLLTSQPDQEDYVISAPAYEYESLTEVSSPFTFHDADKTLCLFRQISCISAVRAGLNLESVTVSASGLDDASDLEAALPTGH